MKDNFNLKLVFSITVIVAFGLAVWVGLDVGIQTPAQAAQPAAFSTPF
jgi:hypothetical protein